MIKRTLVIALALIGLSFPAFAQTDSNLWGFCSALYRAAGGIRAVITINTNMATGESIVLPIAIKMCNEVSNNPAWYVGYDFGPNVTILPEEHIDVTPGYIYYGPRADGQGPYTYSSKYPIYIESTESLCASSVCWQTNFYLCFYEARSQNGQGGPCQVANTDNHMGLVDGHLYDISNTNGLDTAYITNSLIERFGIGSCDNRYDDASSRSAVAFLYFNLPPRTGPNYYCQPGTNFFQYPYQSGMCGYTPDYPPGFGFSAVNCDNFQNWSNYPAPCSTNPYSAKFYRLMCEGSTNCRADVAPSFKRKLTR